MSDEVAVVGKAKKAVKPRVSMERFIEVFESKNSTQEVATELGLKVTTVQARASKYRAELPLKKFAKGGAPKLDKSKAIELLAKLRNQTVEQVQAEADKQAKEKAERKAEKAEKAE